LERIRNQSLTGLRALLRGAFGDCFEIHNMLVRFDVPGYKATPFVRAAATALRVAQRIPGLRTGVRFFQPGFEVVAWKPPPTVPSDRAAGKPTVESRGIAPAETRVVLRAVD
jgi:hypothetical protein